MASRRPWLERQGKKEILQESWQNEWHDKKNPGGRQELLRSREDLGDALAAAKLAFIQGRRKPVGRCGRQAKAACRFRGDGQGDIEILSSEDLKVSVTELEEQLGISEEAGVSIMQVA